MAWDPQLFLPITLKIKTKTKQTLKLNEMDCRLISLIFYQVWFIQTLCLHKSNKFNMKIENFIKKSNNRSKALTIKFFKSYTLRAQGLNFFYKSIFPLVAFLKPPFFSVSIFSVSSVQYLHYSLLLCMVPAECTSRRAFYDVMYRLWAWGAGKQIEMGYIR